ncbi:bifunctional serine/threonine protein kinase/MFS transporter [Kribbella antiqua]|uniref:bifunctional serine/threonine protein kinase/MFS transporter n=1 Tax=Kribbella antiqua TaxID=2512217 RepID=UPI00104FA346|nr:bifunctional serine/threonine protein kinase/MFS transporter [Kribbella antiqua]
MSERTLAEGRYVLSEPPIGVGGMGTVWKAFDNALHREVAVKELRIPEGLSPEERDKLQERARREARAAAGLDHPGIVTIHDVLDEDGAPWIVMRLLPGRSLDQAIRTNGPLSPRRAAELGARLVDALAAAHAKGVLHRDVKPQNVMQGSDGNWMLTDFGIASVAGATRTLTGTGIVTGTLGYIAPERLSSGDHGPPADLWALGATLYYAVEGQHAYDHDDLPAMIAAVLTRDPAPPKHAGPLAPVIAGLMERDPAQRLDAETAKPQLVAIADGYPTFENPTVQLADADKPTEKFGGSTKVLHDGSTLVDRGSEPGSPVPSQPVVRALTWQVAALNSAAGALVALIGYGLTDGMPVGLFAGLMVAFALGGGLGALLAPRLAQWIGVPAALTGSALLMGESLGAIGLLAGTSSPVAVILAGVALVMFAAWLRLSRSLRQRVVPAARLDRATTAYRASGFAGLLLGGAVAGVYFWLRATDAVGGNYVIMTLAGAGIVVVVAALLGIPAVRAASISGRPKRWAPATTAAVALVLPVVVGVQATVHYVDSLDDFTSAPDICSVDALSQDSVAKFITDPPAVDAYSNADHARCHWTLIGDDGDNSAELRIIVNTYANSRAAGHLQYGRDMAERDGKTIVPLQLGDEAIRRSYDGMITSKDNTLGIAVEVRIDNLVLEVDFERGEALGGEPDADQVEALAAELVREIESQKPRR